MKDNTLPKNFSLENRSNRFWLISGRCYAALHTI
ncbi:MAG: DUF2977 domain-containing protein [Pseudomonadota bacterium]